MAIISEEERQRLIHGDDTEEVEIHSLPEAPRRHPRSGVTASLIGMLAALGMFTILGAVTASVAQISGVALDLDGGGTQEDIVVALASTAVMVLISTFVGGFVAGRVARYRGMTAGLGSSLWLIVVLAALVGLALLANEFSPFVDGFDLTASLATLDGADIEPAVAIAGGGLLLLGLGMGLLGGRLGETEHVESVRDSSHVTEQTA